MMIEQALKQYLADKKIQYLEGEGLIKIDVEGERGNWQTFFRIVEDEKLLVVYTLFGYKVQEDKMSDVAILLTDINYGLKIGNFELSRQNGEIHFKTYLDVVAEDLQLAMIERALQMNILSMEHYAQEILKVTVE